MRGGDGGAGYLWRWLVEGEKPHSGGDGDVTLRVAAYRPTEGGSVVRMAEK